MRVFDIGGSGVKTVNLNSSSDIEMLGEREIEYFADPDWANFAEWAFERGLLESRLIGISCAGFVERNQLIKLFRVGGWVNRPLASEIINLSPLSRVCILNDAEAHLMGHVGMYDAPCMSISLGTSLGFSIGDREGSIVRPADDMNFDLGELQLASRASNNKVWWALGANGLSELENELGKVQGLVQYGYRLGAFLANICGVFRPKTVILSGGITESSWDQFSTSMFSEFADQKPAWLEDTDIVKSPYGRNAALVGIAKHVQIQGRSG